MANDLARSVDNSNQIDATPLDFSKAFDKVSHSRLLQKSNHYGIRNSTLSWITEFLQGHTQK